MAVQGMEHFTVLTDDLEATQAFYGGLFGWTFERATPPDSPFTYVIAKLDGDDVAVFQ